MAVRLIDAFPHIPVATISTIVAQCRFGVAQSLSQLFMCREELASLQSLLLRIQSSDFSVPDHEVWAAMTTISARGLAVSHRRPAGGAPPRFPAGLLCPVLLRPNHDAVSLCVARRGVAGRLRP